MNNHKESFSLMTLGTINYAHIGNQWTNPTDAHTCRYDPHASPGYECKIAMSIAIMIVCLYILIDSLH